MEQVSVGDAKPGMVLAKPIIDKQGRTIVNAGATLSQLYISRLAKWGVTDLFIENAAEQQERTEEQAKPTAATQKSAVTVKVEVDEAHSAKELSRPPGVYRGADLEEVIDRCFSGVFDDPLMSALRGAVKRNLLPGPTGEK